MHGKFFWYGRAALLDGYIAVDDVDQAAARD